MQLSEKSVVDYLGFLMRGHICNKYIGNLHYNQTFRQIACK